MGIIKKNELKGMTSKQMEDKVVGLKRELIKINSQVAIGTLPENPGRIKEIKRTIAKLITILSQKSEEKTKEVPKKQV